jgi:hypothetical protein
LLALLPTPNLENHHLSAVHDCLFRIFAATLHYLEAVFSIRNLRTRHGAVTGVRPLRAQDCDTDHYPVVAKVRERLAVSKQTTHTVHMERSILKKLNEVEGKEHYLAEISNTFAALKNLTLR